MLRTRSRNSLLWPICLSVLLLVSIVAHAQAPVPLINVPLVPDAKAPGGTAFTLKVNGTGFVSGSVVNWNGNPRGTTFVSSSQLTATIAASDIATKRTVSVTVANPAPGGGTSNAAFFTVAANTGHSGAFVLDSSPAAGACPDSLAVGDFNGDGKLDLAIADFCSNSVSILLGDGTGHFTPTFSVNTGNGPQSLAMGDFNGDGKPDLATVNYLDGTVSILLGDGTGNFTLASSPATGPDPYAIAIGDFNRDGNLDLAVSNLGNNTISILLGDGAGNFTLASSPGTGWDALSIGVGDFNGDGKLDLAVTSPGDNTVSILLGDGTGNFTLFSSPATGSWPNSVAVGDFNGDGKLDLAVVNYNYAPTGDSVSILLGDGAGNFTLASSPATVTNPFSVALGDFNGDGKLDLAVTNGDSTTILVGDGKGNFSLTSSPPTGCGGEPLEVVVGDFNGDGKLDLAITGYPGNCVCVLLNHGRQNQTTTSLISSPNPSVFWQAVALTAKVSSSAGTPTGTVVFYEGSATLGSATLGNGSGAISVPLTTGSHSFTAEYLGSLEYSASVSAPHDQVVTPGTSATSVVSSLNPAFVQQIVTYTATVTSQYGGAVTGNVAFQDGGVTIATVALTWNQQAAYSTSYTIRGTHTITASYLGDGNNSGSTSAGLIENAWQPTVSSSTGVVTSGSPTFVGQAVTFTATVTPAHGTIPDGELVTFYDGFAQLGAVALAGGKAAYTTSSLSGKTHSIKATYGGDATFKPSTGWVKQVVDKYSTATALSSSLNPSTYGQPVTLTATVTSTGPVPTGKVWFKDGTTGIGTVIVSSGVASLTKSKLAPGTHAITAQYLGDSSNAKSTSAVLNQVVQ